MTKSNSSVMLRPATDDDVDFLARLYATTRDQEMAVVPWSEEEKAVFLRQQFEAQHQHYQQHYPEAEFDLILIGDEPVGRLYVEEWSEELRLIDIALLPEYRNQGIGSRFMHELMDRARRVGKAIRIHVEHFNPALRLYERLGFRLVEDKGVYYFMQWLPGADTSRDGETR